MQLLLKLHRREKQEVDAIVSAVDQDALVRELAALLVQFFQSQREEKKGNERSD